MPARVLTDCWHGAGRGSQCGCIWTGESGSFLLWGKGMPCCASRQFALLLNAGPIPGLPVKRGYHHHPLPLTAGSPLGRASSFHPQILHFMEKIKPKVKCFLGKRALTKRRLRFRHHLVLSSSPHEWANESHSAVSNSLRPHGLYSPWNFPGQNTGVGSLSPSPRYLPNPGIEPRSPALQAGSLPAESQGKPKNIGGNCHFLFRGSFPPRDQTQVSCVSCIVGRFLTTELPGKPMGYLEMHD